MRKIELDKDVLFDLYINKNWGVNDIARKFNVYPGVVRRNLKEYNIIKTPEQYKQYRSDVANKRVQHNNIKYGGNGFASKYLKGKAQETMKERYGTSKLGFDNPETQLKARNTIKEKYGVTAISKNKQVKDKITSTTLKRYGVKRAIMLQEYKDKAMNTRKQRYDLKELNAKSSQTYYEKTGYYYPSQNPEVSNIIKQKMQLKRVVTNNKIQKTMLSRYKRNCYAQVHMSDKVYNIVSNKTNLLNFINSLQENQKNVYDIADILNIHYQTVTAYLKKYDLLSYIKGYGTIFEKEVKYLLDSYGVKYIVRSRKVIPPYELDFYIPSHSLAIECNGTFWHSDKVLQDNKYHYNKSKLCEEKGIRLIHIFEYEWNNSRQRPILENIIKNALSINDKKIYARKCKIKVINKTNILKNFFDDNNIQGFRPGKFAICLEYDNQIVMSYIFGHAFFGKGKYELEVIRGATELGTSVVGGASKIWKYFITHYKYNTCVYYIDYNYFNGNSLPYLNLKYIKTQPSFKNYFIKTNTIRSRDPLHHKEIIEGYKNGDVVQIWNAGTKVYVWTRLDSSTVF